MPALHHIDNKTKLLITSWQGEAIDSDLINAIKKYQLELQCLPAYIDYNEVLNFTQVTDIKLTTKGLMNIGEIASSTDQKNVKKKLAVVVRTNKAFFLARTYAVYRSLSQKSNKEIRIFTQEDKAFEWAQATA
jgi:hypothetical protein